MLLYSMIIDLVHFTEILICCSIFKDGYVLKIFMIDYCNNKSRYIHYRLIVTSSFKKTRLNNTF